MRLVQPNEKCPQEHLRHMQTFNSLIFSQEVISKFVLNDVEHGNSFNICYLFSSLYV